MWKVLRRISKETKGENSMVSVYDTYLNDLQKTILTLTFSLAHLAKVTPKSLAGAFSKAKADDFAKKFNAELAKIEVKQREIAAKLEEKLNSAGKTKA